MRTITVLLLALFATAAFGAPKGALENPQPNDYASGIYLFSGWVCEAETVQIGLDGVQLLDVAYGSDRLDTHDVCGDSDNGFGLLVNMANLAPGAHEAVLYADGQIIAQHAFNTAALSSGEFANDLEGCAISEGFPTSDKDTIVKWTTSMQGFQIIEERERLLSNSLNGMWLADYWNTSIWTYTTECGATSIFFHAIAENELKEKNVVRMSGRGGQQKTLLTSTSNDFVDREAILRVNSASEIQIDFTKCEPDYSVSCGFTPAGGRVILKKLPNVMNMEISPVSE